jgi:predicted NBD/HSP70 family sugar kinase
VTVRLEDVIGGPALLGRAADLGQPVAVPAEIFELPGNPRLKDLRQEALAAMQALFMTVTLAYEPEVIVVGGGIGPALAPWLPELAGGLTQAVPEAPALVLSDLNDFAGALGALARAWQEALVELGLSRPGLDSASAAQLGAIPGVLTQER